MLMSDPSPEFVDPTERLIGPALPPRASPVYKRMYPVEPLADVPVFKERLPELPADTAFEVRMTTTPDEEDSPGPETMDTEPPTAPVLVEPPADTNTPPPSPAPLIPTVRLIDPANPAAAAPVETITEPVLRALLAPVRKVIGPLAPVAPEFAVKILTAALVVNALEPEITETSPPVKDAPVPPFRTTLPPPPALVPSPPNTLTSPPDLADAVVVPALRITSPP